MFQTLSAKSLTLYIHSSLSLFTSVYKLNKVLMAAAAAAVAQPKFFQSDCRQSELAFFFPSSSSFPLFQVYLN